MAQLNWDIFLGRVEGNESLALELAYDLLICVDEYVDNLKVALAQASGKQIELSAHALRGLIAPYGGKSLLAILKAIEEEVRGDGASSFKDLPAEIATMVRELKGEIKVKLTHYSPKKVFGMRPERTL